MGDEAVLIGLDQPDGRRQVVGGGEERFGGGLGDQLVDVGDAEADAGGGGQGEGAGDFVGGDEGQGDGFGWLVGSEDFGGAVQEGAVGAEPEPELAVLEGGGGVEGEGAFVGWNAGVGAIWR